MKKIFALWTAMFAVVALALSGCSTAPEKASQEKSQAAGITVTDFHGRQVKLPKASERSVFLVENAMNTMMAVGGSKKIVGTGEVWEPTFKKDFLEAVHPGFSKLPVIASQDGSYDLEALAALKPDFVVLWAESADDKAIAAIEETLKVPVYAAFLTSFADLDKLAVDMANVNGTPERGAAVNALVKKQMDKIAEKTSTIEKKPSVFWMWGDAYGTAGTKSSANDLIEAAGGTNVIAKWDNSAKASEHPVVSLETLAKLNPDAIYMWYNSEIDPSDVIEGKNVGGVGFSAWKNLDAVKNKQVFELDDPFLYDMMTGRLPMATAKVAQDINPAAFKEWDNSAETDQYFVDMYGLHYPGFKPAQ
ncbi:iron ABC transporter substrate-binding protein [Corynebacterium ulcerans]|uniref:ABC transporter substrate-binding protein n=1 Tax=Corynebacterium ulcerans TaxID=65058 RepID=UPI000C810702|nr:ABC transporter substrate-binding protein [Corynebacterium ulcerans]PME08002.1 iron ABC transporter substrate-binding protein [Corynebacterium ulcerans]